MAEILAGGAKAPIYVGANGNKSFASSRYQATGLPTNSIIKLFKLPVGTKIHALRLVNDSLGAVIIDFAVRYKDGTQDALLTSIGAGPSGGRRYPITPFYIGDKGDAELIAITSGTANGEFFSQIEYTATGY